MEAATIEPHKYRSCACTRCCSLGPNIEVQAVLTAVVCVAFSVVIFDVLPIEWLGVVDSNRSLDAAGWLIKRKYSRAVPEERSRLTKSKLAQRRLSEGYPEVFADARKV